MLDFAVWFYTRLWRLFLAVGRAGNSVVAAIMVASARAAYLLRDVSRSDGNARPTPYGAANTSLSHEAIGLWTAAGFLKFGAPEWAAVVGAVLIWGVVWEARQYLTTPTVRTLRDWIIGDLPSYAVGAVAAAVLIGDAVAGRWVEWLVLTPLVVLWPGVVGAVFGRVNEVDE
jgi:hypothetical protein